MTKGSLWACSVCTHIEEQKLLRWAGIGFAGKRSTRVRAQYRVEGWQGITLHAMSLMCGAWSFKWRESMIRIFTLQFIILSRNKMGNFWEGLQDLGWRVRTFRTVQLSFFSHSLGYILVTQWDDSSTMLFCVFLCLSVCTACVWFPGGQKRH